MNRPLVQDLKKRYKNNGFFLSNDRVLGQCVCLFDGFRARQIVKMLRKRGFLCCCICGTWHITNGGEQWK